MKKLVEHSGVTFIYLSINKYMQKHLEHIKTQDQILKTNKQLFSICGNLFALIMHSDLCQQNISMNNIIHQTYYIYITQTN